MKFFFIFVCSIISVAAQEVITVEWKTKHGAPVAAIHQSNTKFSQLLLFGVNQVSEPLIMQFAGIGGAKLGLSKKQAVELQKSLSSYYLKMAKETKDGKFPAIPTALDYCYSKQIPTQGFATVYLPKHLNQKTRSIIFLHGYGGSFSYYLHFLATNFPDHIIICPAYGMSMGNVPDEYLAECKSAVSQQLKRPLKKPLLIGLSAGGYGGFRHYSKNINHYSRFISIASLPPPDLNKPLSSSATIRLIAGGNEHYVQSKLLKTRINKLRLKNYRQVILPDQGHFFMLTSEAQTRASLKEMIND